MSKGIQKSVFGVLQKQGVARKRARSMGKTFTFMEKVRLGILGAPESTAKFRDVYDINNSLDARTAIKEALLEARQAILKLQSFEHAYPNEASAIAAKHEEWPILLSRKTPNADSRRLIAHLKLGEDLLFPVNRTKFEVRKNTARDAASALLRLIYHGAGAPKQPAENAFFPLVEYHLRQVSEVLGVPLQTSSKLFAALPRRRTESLWTDPTKLKRHAESVLDALTDGRPELIPILRTLGKYRANHYSNKFGKDPEKTREVNIRNGLLTRIKDAIDRII